MNLKKIYVYSAIITFLVNNGNIIMSDIEEVKEAKSRLKFRTDLSKENKTLINDINKQVFIHVILTDLVTLGIDFIPILNVMFSVYIYKNKENMAISIKDYSNERVKQINNDEEIRRQINYQSYISFVSEQNLEPLIDISKKDILLSDRELINLIKTHDINPDLYERKDDGTLVLKNKICS